MKNVIIYTAIFGDKDGLKDPLTISDRCKYICYTDNPNLKSNIWDIRVVNPGLNDNNLNAKYFKVLPHRCFEDEEIENSIWIDGAREIIGDMDIFIEKVANNFQKDGIRILKHPEGRNCLFKEIEKILHLNSQGNFKAPKDILLKQKNKYEREGMPKNFGLFNCPILIRKHTNKETKKNE